MEYFLSWLVTPFLSLFFLRACYGVLRFIMESGAKGCEVVVSGKLRGQRAKSMKFVDGLMIHSGDPVNYYVDTAVRHVLLRQGEPLRMLGAGVFVAGCWKSFRETHLESSQGLLPTCLELQELTLLMSEINKLLSSCFSHLCALR